MKKLAFLIMLFAAPYFCLSQATYPFGTILKKVYADQGKNLANATKVGQATLSSIQADGTWKEVDYTDQSATGWKPAAHLERVDDLVQAYSAQGSSFRNNDKLYQAIVKSLQVWYDKDPKSSNWWHNEINVPQKLGVILVLLQFADKQLPEELQQKLIDRMKRGDMVTKTGANKTDIAMHYFYRSLITEDKNLLQESLTELFKPVSLVDGEEGLQYDFSYLQHGPQLYIGGYGNVFLGGVIKIAGYVAGTPYALSKDKLALLSKFYRDTYLKTFRSRYVDFNTEGRGVTRPNNLRKPSEKYRLAAMMNIDADNTSFYENERSRVDSSGSFTVAPFHQHFWKGDYTIHVRPEYSFNVRIASKRTKRSEMGNNENLYGKYLSDGATNIQPTGPEYYNIMPVWEWDKIPGTTATDHAEDVKMTVNWGEEGKNEFAGGVSDCTYGATAYQLDYDGVKAKKAWFFFDKEIVALGTDISSSNNEAIVTTLNQTWLEGSVSSSFAGIKKDESAQHKVPAASWVQHNNVVYYFPLAQNVGVSTQVQSGSWNKINLSHPKTEVKGNVFKLWLNHGIKPDTASYQYIVLPATKNAKSFDPKSIDILSNNAKNQAVYHQQLKMLQAAFYSASTLISDTYVISVDQPCVLLLKDKKLYIADPLQQQSMIKVQVKQVKTGKSATMEIQLPSGPNKGASKEVQLSFQ
jgi:chondroitin AC lyase